MRQTLLPPRRASGLTAAALRRVFRQGGFGDIVSGAAFGHDGAGGQIAWCDPATGISLAFVHNTFGPEANPGRVARDMEISNAAAVCAVGGAKL